MPRQNRLEVTPPPAHAHWGQTKAQISAQGVEERGCKAGICNVSSRGIFLTIFTSNGTPSHQDLSLHAYEVSATSGLSISSEALTQMSSYTYCLSPGQMSFITSREP